MAVPRNLKPKERELVDFTSRTDIGFRQTLNTCINRCNDSVAMDDPDMLTSANNALQTMMISTIRRDKQFNYEGKLEKIDIKNKGIYDIISDHDRVRKMYDFEIAQVVSGANRKINMFREMKRLELLMELCDKHNLLLEEETTSEIHPVLGG